MVRPFGSRSGRIEMERMCWFVSICAICDRFRPPVTKLGKFFYSQP